MFKKTLLATSALLISSTAFAADVENSNLDIAFQGAHFQGAGNQVTMLRVPVTNKDTGQTQFFDMSAQFAADKNGNLIFKKMSSVKSVAFASANQRIAGHYLDSNNCSWFVEGPSVGAQGRLAWSILNTNDTKGCHSNNTYSAQVLSGPIIGNELIMNLRPYKTLSKLASNNNLNYGTDSKEYAVTATQSGKSISFSTYRYDNAENHANWTIRQSPYLGKKED